MPDPSPSPRPRSVVVVGDLAGDDRYHAGDEAMALAAVDLLGTSGGITNAQVIATSSNPAATANRLGCQAVDWVGFINCGDEPARQRMLTTVTGQVMGHLANGDTSATGTSALPGLLRAVINADAVVVAGGGNLNSHWPEHIYERVAVSRAATAAGVPVVVIGQTLGPRIDDAHRPLLVELLTGAQMVGVREFTSHATALDLGIDPTRLMLQADDALLLADGGVPALPEGFDPGTPDMPRRFIAVTIHPFATPDDARIAALADQLATVANRIGAQLLFVPHMRGAEGPGGTSDVDIAIHMAGSTGGWAMTEPDARGVAWAARNAWVVVSSRYHPLVFATSAAVPSLALVWDHYTSVKCRGALAHVQLDNWWLNVNDAVAGSLEPALTEVTRRRVEISSWTQRFARHFQALDAQRRSRVFDALGLVMHHPAPPARDTIAGSVADDVPSCGRTVPEPAGQWARTQR